ncbi:ATP-binding protein [Novosphingobium sp. KCTC 2891]|uniref:ATP-binding protein n=1 Tax=Novosphingobium sp. KCTC 2891 TaxID=2989730 RepID=UPI002221A290|nr:ATP-binding protein [Novosphingobium sp. KCTC 2891]MCW1383922.1 ATP-binding protein [Novosphingobium sp. KCTC 2891]
MGKRSITDPEIGLIKAMLMRGMANNSIQFYFNRQDRPVNSGRITGIRQGKYGPEVAKATDAELTEFLSNFTSAEPTATVVEIEGALAVPALPMDDSTLRSFFRREADGRWFFAKGESDEFECKENFNIRNFSKPLKTIAGFANNRGGYLLFGVKDLPHAFEVCGLADDRFAVTDQNKFSQTIRSALAPTPRFEVATIQLDGLKVGIIHVEPHTSKPVIACKNEGDVIEGAIYYRYSGETKAISYADLRAILDERDLRSREAILPMVQRLLELGPGNALVANLADGQLEGGKRPILIDPASLEQIKFIKEGAFDEVDGAPTLKVVGDAQVAPVGSVLPVRTVREEITVEAILRNFIGRNAVEQPFAYFRQVSHEAGWISPVFYYLHLAGKTRKEAASALRSNKNAKPKCRAELIKLLNGKRTLHAKLGGNRLTTFNRIVSTPNLEVSDLSQAKAICLALTGMTEADADTFDQFHSLLGECLKLWEASDGDRELLTCIRRAASRLDEVEYGPKVPTG